MSINPIIFIVLIAWLLAEVIKVITASVKKDRFALDMLFKTGGMPSAHTAFVSALSTSIGLTEGINSTIFIITASFSLIVIHDAFAVRGVIGKQLNKLMKPTLSEVINIGHSISEVLMGMTIGIAIPLLLL